MSDAHRKSFHTSEWVEQTLSLTPYSEWFSFVGLFIYLTYTARIEAKETLIPDFTKSTHQKAKEYATDAADRVARYVCVCVEKGP